MSGNPILSKPPPGTAASVHARPYSVDAQPRSGFLSFLGSGETVTHLSYRTNHGQPAPAHATQAIPATRRGLVDASTDWAWSSAREYAGIDGALLRG